MYRARLVRSGSFPESARSNPLLKTEGVPPLFSIPSGLARSFGISSATSKSARVIGRAINTPRRLMRGSSGRRSAIKAFALSATLSGHDVPTARGGGGGRRDAGLQVHPPRLPPSDTRRFPISFPRAFHSVPFSHDPRPRSFFRVVVVVS